MKHLVNFSCFIIFLEEGGVIRNPSKGIIKIIFNNIFIKNSAKNGFFFNFIVRRNYIC